MFKTRSIAWLVAGPALFAGLVGFAIATAGILAAFAQSTDRRLRGEITADIASLRYNEDRLRIVAISDAIDHRISAFPESQLPAYYLLLDRANRKITGNLGALPNIPEQGGWFLFELNNRKRILAYASKVGKDFTLVVGRESKDISDYLSGAWPVLGLAALGSVIAILLLLRLSGRRLSAVVGKMNDVIQAARTGQTNARLDVNTSMAEIATLEQHINNLLDVVERQLHNMRQVSTQAAHELRTPLARVVASLQRSADADTVAFCRQELTNAIDLLQSLLDIAEHESALGASAALVDLAAVCRNVANVYQDIAQANSISFTLNTEHAPVLGEAGLITRLVANLLDNAIKAAPADSSISINSGINGANAFIAICDQGPGIQNRSLDELVQNASSNHKGPGLGLRFARAIALRHGGKLILSANTPRGTCATFRIASS
jgi:signal transduction histidine kinase